MSKRAYRSVLGTDVPNNGTYYELRDDRERVVAVVFRSHVTGEFEIDVRSEMAPRHIIMGFIEHAKKGLAKRDA